MRIGLIGAGAIARRHVAVLAELEGVEIAAVSDTDPERASQLAPGAAVFSDWATLLGEALDGVFVCTPPTAHRGPALAAFERGVSTYLEKPLARGLDDGEAIAAAWRESGTVCAVGYQWRSLRLLERARAALDEQPPGMLISRSIGPAEPGRADSWFGDPAASGGILFELGSHDIDLQLALAGGRAESVQAASARGLLTAGGALDDAVAAVVRYESGTLGVVAVAWAEHAQPPTYSLDIVGDEAALRLELDPAFRLTGSDGDGEVSLEEGADPRVTSVVRFLDAARRGDPAAVPCTPADALETLRVALAAERAIATGGTVAVKA